ncbi:uncharacterized protein LOC143432076 [Xylocopa sonorina]|uniref:uncharacterized protein LOC143432076 n=1 Tax=Xylocopa sonorina TaxID=1818115 RepID=UPI00403AC126
MTINTWSPQLPESAQVHILDKDLQPVNCRTLVDTGATTNFITEDLVKRLGIPTKGCHVPVGALNQLSTVARHTATATIRSKFNSYERTLTFLTMPKISSLIPDQPIDRSLINIPKNIKLADPEFHRPAPIDILLGSGTTLSLITVGQINLSTPTEPNLYLQKTMFGWVIGGSAPTTLPIHDISCHTTNALQFDLTRFWEVEEGPQVRHLSNSDHLCETHFKEHVTRNAEGRYIVALPFNEKQARLGESKVRALRRLESLERKLQRNPTLKQEYHAVIQEYLQLGHMTQISQNEEEHNGYYLPHHGVTKVTSETTKLRVVFDGSAETSTGVSLNDALHTGPKIQDDLLYILLRFRVHQYVITGDIEKMYRQFLIRKEDRKYQRILWRDDTGRVQTYELQTVTFGLSAAPYLAIRCLTQLAQDEGHRFPLAATALLRDFYVDDALTGAPTLEGALQLRKELTGLLNSSGLNIRQWAANDKTLLDGLPEQSINKRLHLGESSTLKTLGIVWNSSADTISYEVQPRPNASRVTKRFITSEIAKIYDPLGLLGPVIILAKMLLQKIWTIKIDWDESLPMDLHTEWNQYYKQLPLLNKLVFQRRTVSRSPTTIEIHGFCDASEKAYGACLYVRTIDEYGHIHVQLLVAKSRVAPLKTQSIPRLELCGALLLTSLLTTTKEALHIKIHRTFMWTDSTIVLHWIRTSPHLLKTFVANRVSEIQSRTDTADWRHISTSENPADLISRGQQPQEFIQPSIWQFGPTWLSREESSWPKEQLEPCVIIPEQKTATCLNLSTIDANILDKFSSWHKMQRVAARCLRWKRNNQEKGGLTADELARAHDALIKLLQRTHFRTELHKLKNNQRDVGGKFQRLAIFLDKDGILRVGGRLRHSPIPFSQRHPILLPKAHVTTLIIQAEHHTHLHAGVQNTLYAVRRRYWPIDGRSQVWKALRNCIPCIRARPPAVNYTMGDLPEARVTESRPFTHVGIDYCGPFFIKERKHRSRNQHKAYVAVFVCLAVKAVHLELVSDLTSKGFIAALKRFIARRGLCKAIYSDNGRNFVGADNELQELIKSNDYNQQLGNYLENRAIKWNFIPPRTPHFGGLWEAAVKSFKHHLTRVAGTEPFTFENFNTLIIEIEAVLNSRPLTPISSDPNDLIVLTPGHFLIGESLTSLRERNFVDVPTNRLSAWQHIQKLKQHFWKRWHLEYLNELTKRSKWKNGTHSIKEGTIVLLREDNVPPMQWILGRVLKAHPGFDGVVRVVTVKTSTSVLNRSVKGLAPLLYQPGEEDDLATSVSTREAC